MIKLKNIANIKSKQGLQNVKHLVITFLWSKKRTLYLTTEECSMKKTSQL